MKINILYARGLTLTKDVYNKENNILLVSEGKVLTQELIDKLKKHGISDVDIDITEVPTICSRELEVDASKAIVNLNFNEIAAIASTYASMEEILDEIPVDMTKYLRDDIKIVTPLLLSTNSIIPALKIAKAYNRNVGKSEQIDLRELAIAVMCQDIGYILSNNEIYFQSVIARYNEEYQKLLLEYPELESDYINTYNKKAHAIYSHYLMKDHYLGTDAELAVLFHNETYQLSEYGILKTSLKAEEKYTKAAKMAMILKAVDCYNKLLYTGRKQNPEYPFEIVPKYLEQLVANGTLSPEFVNILKEAVPLFPEGTNVMLSDGTVAQVSRYNKNDMLNPKIVDMNGNEIEDSEYLKVAYPIGELTNYKRPKHL